MLFYEIFSLTEGKYYVGKRTDNWRWLRRYPIVESIATGSARNRRELSRVVERYIRKYGYDNVRGGPWTAMEMPRFWADECIKSRYCRGECVGCGYATHTIDTCFARCSRDASGLPWVEEGFGRYPKNIVCVRCKRIGHLVQDCYASIV